MYECRGKGLCHSLIGWAKREFGEGALRVFAVEKRNERLRDIPHMVPLGIPVDDDDRVFNEHSFGRNDELRDVPV